MNYQPHVLLKTKMVKTQTFFTIFPSSQYRQQQKWNITNKKQEIHYNCKLCTLAIFMPNSNNFKETKKKKKKTSELANKQTKNTLIAPRKSSLQTTQ